MKLISTRAIIYGNGIVNGDDEDGGNDDDK